MSVVVLNQGTRRASKSYRCELCGARIHPKDHYAFQSNVFDDRAYTWRECLACDRDKVCVYVTNYCDPDEGATFDAAYEWAEDAMGWPFIGWRTQRRMLAGERMAARNWLARAAGDD